MTEEQIIAKIDESIIEEFELEPGVWHDEAHLVEDIGFDSLDFVDLVVLMQETIGLKLRNDGEIRNIRLVKDVHSFIIQKMKDSGKL